jgi:capping protein alpha
VTTYADERYNNAATATFSVRSKENKFRGAEDEEAKDEDVKEEDTKEEDVKEEDVKEEDVEDEDAKDEDIKDEDAAKPERFDIYIVGNKYNPSNYWCEHLPSFVVIQFSRTVTYRTGRWRSSYTLDLASSPPTLTGTIFVNVHYYEQGNVRFFLFLPRLNYCSIPDRCFSGPTLDKLPCISLFPFPSIGR